MIAIIDVQYSENIAYAVCLLFQQWEDDNAYDEIKVKIDDIEKYCPGEFYKRELPCILALLEQVKVKLDYIVIDGYVWLDENGKKGLGGYLTESLESEIPIIGVAKNSFNRGEHAIAIQRGDSQKLLYVTSAGISKEEAAEFIKSMHGKFRLPTLIKAVDTAAREFAKEF